jgi:hypothetical protein
VLVEKMRQRGAARCFRIDRKAADKMLVHAVSALRGRIDRTFSRKLEGLTDWLDQILIDDCSVHAKLCNDKFDSRATTTEMAGFQGSNRKR